MNIALVQRLLATGAIILAIWLGLKVANGEYVLPLIAVALALAGSLVWLLRVSFGPLLLGAILVGYFVGNRGFAQLMPIPDFPLLPAELALAAAGGWLVVQSALARQLPVRRDLLNHAVLLWLAVGTARALFDVQHFGFVALRDFAMVYYALFFFLGQAFALEPRGRRFLRATLVFASAAAPIAALLSASFPTFFQTVLTWRGVPLILFKGDLALTFTGVSALVLALTVEGRWRWPALLVATGEIIAVLGGDNRASALGAIAALAWLALSRARRFVAGQAVAVAAAVAVLVAVAHLTELPWARQKLDGLTERVYSLTDFFGRRTYVSDESVMKGDNNLFRTFWWRAVIQETLAEGPVLGLGFGHDLAQNFLQQYNPEMADDFTARSPHSILVSTFGRMGFVGLGILLLLLTVLTVRTWRAVRDPAGSRAALGLWTSLWVIFISACFGVVLEGPMGAVVFWTLLGLASASSASEVQVNDAEPAAPNLRTGVPTDELAPAP